MCRCDVSLVAPPFTPPTVPADPLFGGLRFTLRVENTDHRWVAAELQSGLAGLANADWELEMGLTSPCVKPRLPMWHGFSSGTPYAPGRRSHSPALPVHCCRRGYADEVYVVVVPRHPAAAKTATAAGAAPTGVPLALPPASPVMEEELQATKEQQISSQPGEGPVGGAGGAQWGMAIGKAVGAGTAPEPATPVAAV